MRRPAIARGGVALLLFATLSASGCRFFAMRTAPEKVASTTRHQSAIEADEIFWKTFRGGNYDGIDAALIPLKAAYLENPNDAVTAAHIAWLHLWRVSEAARQKALSPTVTDDLVLARRYFEEAVRLDPHDARYRGFLASAKLAEGSIHADQKLIRDGYFSLLASIDHWPEFNLFTAGYVMSRQPADSKRFRQAVDWQWRNLELCAGRTFDRKNPDLGGRPPGTERQGPKRACWNSPLAPHNIEGFFLNFGDMLVKSGDWQTARIMYANAKTSPDYATWRYRAVLEERIANAETNVAAFNGASDRPERGGIMLTSEFSCLACHQE